ncbi:MAG: hypothetical protein BMS9Abin05_2247 [Rhodothermia bacterium]|nr:MAG: hypothetical protein BMS9Abin05_2247 [Rhodothermia bacterium]
MTQSHPVMQENLDHYSLLADLFVYPESDFGDRVRCVQNFLDDSFPEAGARLEPFTEFAESATTTELEELFLRSFDVQSITTLDIGYVLFGDDYKRGAVLVNLNREHAQVSNPCNSELADHLPNVLRLLPLLADVEFRFELVDRIVAPALRKIIGEFDPRKIDAKNKVYMRHHNTLIESSDEYGVLYQSPLQSLFAVLESDFELSDPQPPSATSEFLKNIDTEIQLEEVDA